MHPSSLFQLSHNKLRSNIYKTDNITVFKKTINLRATVNMFDIISLKTKVLIQD